MLSAPSFKSAPYVLRRRRNTYQVARDAIHVLYTLSTSITPGPAVGLVRVKLLTLICFLTFFIQSFPSAIAIFAGILILPTVSIISSVSLSRPL